MSKTKTAPYTAPDTNVKRKLVNPGLLSLAHTPYLDITVTGPFETLHAPKLSRNEDGNVTVLPVINNDTGECAHLLSTTVLENTLRKMNDNYIGKRFQVESGEPIEGKDWRPVRVYEVEQ